jgi:hypothetical protein
MPNKENTGSININGKSYIPLIQFAGNKGFNHWTVRAACVRGAITGAININHNWLIPIDCDWKVGVRGKNNRVAKNAKK